MMTRTTRRSDFWRSGATRIELGVAAVAVAALVVAAGASLKTKEVVIGAKAFTESIILAEAAALLGESVEVDAEAREFGGTQVLWSALRSGSIDAYFEYTGTLRKEIFPDEDLQDAELRLRLAGEGIVASEFLGFNNSYALGMKREVADRLGIDSIKDLARHPDIRYGFGNEFKERSDGWPALRKAYQLQGEVVGLDHQLAYQALDAGDLDVVDVYTTDPAIAAHDLKVLKDDFFPRYDALLLYRIELEKDYPEFVRQMRRLEGEIDDTLMLRMNEAVQIRGRSERRTAAELLNTTLAANIEVVDPTIWQRLARTTRGHFFLVATSLFGAIIVAVPCGVLAAKRPALGQVIVTLAEVVQTIPGLALLVFLSAALQAVSLPSLDKTPVICALFFYSLLPILRNTMAGIQAVPLNLRESAQALGLSPHDQLLRVELPLAAQTILAGIKTTAVINVGYATLGGLIGAVCYGEPIMSGLRKNSTALMLEGAVPAAVMALLVKLAFEWAEKRLVYNGGT